MRWIRSTALGSALSLLALTGPAPVQACDDDHGEDSVELREAAAHRIAWRSNADADDAGGHRSPAARH